VYGGIRPSINNSHSKKYPSELISLLEKCWNVGMEARASFKEISYMLESITTSAINITPKKSLKHIFLRSNVARLA